MNALLIIGGLLAMSAVMLGAFGAHALRGTLSADLLAVFQTGVQYQFYHALGLLIVGTLLRQYRSAWLLTAGWCMVAGVALFSGSLYILALTDTRWLGAITPLGGVAFVAAWLAFTLGVWRGQR